MSSLGFQLILLALTIGGLLIVLRLRVFLGRIFPHISARVFEGAASSGSEDLYQDAHHVLTKMGFDGPVWLQFDNKPKETELFDRMAVYRHKDSGTLCWLAPVFKATTPNRLLTFWTTRLLDGRLLTSQAFDFYFESIATPQYPAQTIDGSDLPLQFQQHLCYVQGFGLEFDPASLESRAIAEQSSTEHNRQVEHLIETGLLYRKNNRVRGGLRYALRTLWLSLRQPTKAKHESLAHTPVSRLDTIGDTADKSREIAPDAKTQFSLFSATLLLSCILGGLIFSLEFAIIIVAIVVFHEYGHYLAMRLFGYKNVHMLALPLVGGVTIGFEENPCAARKAWMALMGPLPGIILGWLLFWLYHSCDLQNSTLEMTIYLLLFINYLNVLPVLPLDGGHVVQSLIPGRWYNLQPAIVLLSCVLGIVLGIIMKFYILSVLCALQFPRLIQQFKLGGIIRRILSEELAAEPQSRSSKRRHILQMMENLCGPARNAGQRLNEAEVVLDTIYRRKLSPPQFISLSSVYALLLVVPVFIGAFFAMESLNNSALEAKAEQRNQVYEKLQSRADTLSPAQLLSELSDKLPQGASQAQLSATQERLGVTLPAELKALYQLANGIPQLGLLPLDELNYVSWENENLSHYLRDGNIEVGYYNSDRQWQEVQLTVSETRSWISLRDTDTAYEPLLLDTSASPSLGGMPYTSLYEAYPSINHWLRSLWVGKKHVAQITHQRDLAFALRFGQLQDSDTETVLERFPQPNLFDRIIGKVPAWPKGANEHDIASTENQLDRKFPATLRTVYLNHDAFRPLSLLPVRDIELRNNDAVSQAIEYPESYRQFNPDGKTVPVILKPAALRDCYRLGGTPIQQEDEREYTHLFWCPDAESKAQQFVDLGRNMLFADFELLLKYSAARFEW